MLESACLVVLVVADIAHIVREYLRIHQKRVRSFAVSDNVAILKLLNMIALHVNILNAHYKFVFVLYVKIENIYIL